MSSYLASSLGPVRSLKSGASSRARGEILGNYFDNGFRYSRKLSEHKSCVNALSFSNGDGKWLASAGDDRRVLLWDMHQENLEKSSCRFDGHRANIFTLDFSASNQYVYSTIISGGTDDTVMKYDLTRWTPQTTTITASSVNIFEQHSDTVRAVSCHPTQDEVFLSAGEDGKVLMHDGRTGSRMSQAEGTLQESTEVTGVQFHPRMDNIFLTSDNHGKNAFPVIFSLADPLPLAVCSGHNLPNGTAVPQRTRTFSNCCTIKVLIRQHGSFGGPGPDGDGYFSCGSDDFRGYVWKLPSSGALARRRRIIDEEGWRSKQWPGVTAYMDEHPGEKCVPLELSTPLCHLNGSYRQQYMASINRVERCIMMHSPSPSTPCGHDFSLSPTEVRKLPHEPSDDDRRLISVFHHDELMQSDEEDAEAHMIASFDVILRNEGDIGAFQYGRNPSPTSYADDEMEEDPELNSQNTEEGGSESEDEYDDTDDLRAFEETLDSRYFGVGHNPSQTIHADNEMEEGSEPNNQNTGGGDLQNEHDETDDLRAFEETIDSRYMRS
ncbi:hypothetical protein EW146_g4128 [Bondarzewia mesenterica]|uniref:Uncharacterized protein n=1 Tax=Bondarzewia mesenterica TaxID=1095465 RepID=A0A4V3XF89_9AGAM|nr:hypothetical protein EW146_g4128 [Bondarzewia mesenterica]